MTPVSPGADPRIERSRSVIHAATIEELAEVGYGAMTIESIARRAGVGKAIPADQKHRIASLWIDPWVLSFDFATTNLDTPDGETPDMKAVYRSLAFHNECFESMRSGETWGQTATNIAPPVAAEASDR